MVSMLSMRLFNVSIEMIPSDNCRKIGFGERAAKRRV